MARARRGRGEGGVCERPDGRWSATISLGVGPDGKRRRKTVYGRTKREVLEKLNAVRATAPAGTLPAADTLTVGQLLDRWLASTKAGGAARTHEERERVVRNHLHPRVGRVRLAALNAMHVEGLYADLRAAGVGGWTVRTAADLLSIALNYAVRLKLIPANPARAVPKPRGPKRDMLFLDPDQARAVRAACAGRPVGALVVTALGTGCRQGELLALGWDDVDLTSGRLAVRKSLTRTKAGYALKAPKTEASRRTISLPEFVVTALTAHRAAAAGAGLLSAPVFCTQAGGYLDKKNVLRAFRGVLKAASKAAGPDAKPIPAGVRFHDVRHSVASLLLSAGHSLKAVSARLGHANPTMTLRVYAHVMPTDDGRLADGLGEILG